MNKLEKVNEEIGIITDTLMDYDEDAGKLDRLWRAGERDMSLQARMKSIHRCKRPLILRREELIEQSLMLESISE